MELFLQRKNLLLRKGSIVSVIINYRLHQLAKAVGIGCGCVLMAEISGRITATPGHTGSHLYFRLLPGAYTDDDSGQTDQQNIDVANRGERMHGLAGNKGGGCVDQIMHDADHSRCKKGRHETNGQDEGNEHTERE